MSTPQRVDLYAAVHKGLRRALYETAVRIGATDFRDEAAAKRVEGACREVLWILEVHAEKEKSFIQPRLESAAPYVAGQLAGDHHAQEREMRELLGLAARTGTSPAPERPALGRELYVRFDAFVTDQLLHMSREETQGSRALWACYSDEVLVEVQGDIIASMGVEALLAFAGWMAPALDPEERARLLGGLLRRAPTAAVGRVIERIRSVLAPEEFHRLSAAVELPG